MECFVFNLDFEFFLDKTENRFTEFLENGKIEKRDVIDGRMEENMFGISKEDKYLKELNSVTEKYVELLREQHKNVERETELLMEINEKTQEIKKLLKP